MDNVRTRIGPRPFGKEVDDWVSYRTRRLSPASRRQSALLAWAVFAAVTVAHWLLRWPLGDEMAGSQTDAGFSPLQPLIWLAVAALAGYTLLRLREETPLHLLLALVAAGAGLLHFLVLIVAGVLGSFTDSSVMVEVLDAPRNIIHVVTFVAAAELARAVLFDVWSRWNRDLAFVAVTAVFFVTGLTAAQHTPWDTLVELRLVVGGVWVPALAISIIATSLVELGGPVASFAYRIVLLGLLWLSPVLPDLDWFTLALVGAIVPWVTWRLISAVYRRTPEGKHHVGPPQERPASKITRAVVGLGLMIVIVVAGLVVIFGTGLVGYRTQIIDNPSMEPGYEVGDVVLVRDDVNAGTLDVGDIVVVRVDDHSAIRRITEITGVGDNRMFTTEADGEAGSQSTVGDDQIVGEVFMRIPDIGHLVLDWRD